MPRPPSIASVLLAVALAGPARPAAAYTPAEGKAPMAVTLVRSDGAGCGADCPEWLALTGVIGPGTPVLFSAALGRLGRRNVPVLVDSPGGSVEAAMAIGRVVRARRMTVIVAGTALTDCAPADRACAARRRTGERPGFVAGGIAACASACVLILAAGTERSVGANSYVGVHQMIVHKTMTRVMNYFRIVRRMVDGRPVEVSRTLLRTEPISSRTVLATAPDALYSEVDRYLLGLGIAESIMPLMRSAPPSGVHWMTPAELAATRIATDTTEARTRVERDASQTSKPESASAVPKPSSGADDRNAAGGTPGLAIAALGDDKRVNGSVTWRIVGGTEHPTLVAEMDVPTRGLHGTLRITHDDPPGQGGFLAVVDFGHPTAIEAGRVWTTGAPRVCDATTCRLSFTPTAETDDGRGKRGFRVVPLWGDNFLSNLAERDRISIPLSADDGKDASVALSIDGEVRTLIDDWTRLCRGRPEVQAPATVQHPS